MQQPFVSRLTCARHSRREVEDLVFLHEAKASLDAIPSELLRVVVCVLIALSFRSRAIQLEAFGCLVISTLLTSCLDSPLDNTEVFRVPIRGDIAQESSRKQSTIYVTCFALRITSKIGNLGSLLSSFDELTIMRIRTPKLHSL